jgi:hypothetical protein
LESRGCARLASSNLSTLYPVPEIIIQVPAGKVRPKNAFLSLSLATSATLASNPGLGSYSVPDFSGPALMSDVRPAEGGREDG